MTRARQRRRRRRPVLSLVIRLVILGAVFAAGVALGQALRDNPKPGATVTRVRTLVPLRLAQTVTVTVTSSGP